MDANARSAWLFAIHAAPAMRRAGGGRIVNVSDWLPVSGRPRYTRLHGVLRVEGSGDGADGEPRPRAGARRPGQRRRSGADPGAARPDTPRRTPPFAAPRRSGAGAERRRSPGRSSSSSRPTSSPASRSGSTAAAISPEVHMRIRAVIFDLGGVVIGSPLHAIAAYERELGLATNAVNHVVVRSGPTGAWSRLERGELGLEEFYPLFEADCARRRRRDRRARDDATRGGDRRTPSGHARGDPQAARRRPAGGGAHQQLDHRGPGHGRAARVLRRVRRVDRGRAAQARPAHLPARLPRAGRRARRRRCSSTTSAAT